MDNTKFSLFERSKLPGLIGREGGNPTIKLGLVAATNLRLTRRGWTETAPAECSGHPLLPGRTQVGYQPYSYPGGHHTWALPVLRRGYPRAPIRKGLSAAQRSGLTKPVGTPPRNSRRHAVTLSHASSTPGVSSTHLLARGVTRTRGCGTRPVQRIPQALCRPSTGEWPHTFATCLSNRQLSAFHRRSATENLPESEYSSVWCRSMRTQPSAAGPTLLISGCSRARSTNKVFTSRRRVEGGEPRGAAVLEGDGRKH